MGKRSKKITRSKPLKATGGRYKKRGTSKRKSARKYSKKTTRPRYRPKIKKSIRKKHVKKKSSLRKRKTDPPYKNLISNSKVVDGDVSYNKTSSDIRRNDPETLTLPSTPSNLESMSRHELLQIYDRVGDFWATWLGRASMLPETFEDYTNDELKKVIKLATSQWARDNWKYHDYKRYPNENKRFYDEFFKRWQQIVSIPSLHYSQFSKFY